MQKRKSARFSTSLHVGSHHGTSQRQEASRQGPKSIETVTHKDQRTNIPTEELRGFVAEDEQTPKALLYPRDPSLDPQLVWKGKDEQDSKDLGSRRRADIYPGENSSPSADRGSPRQAPEGDQETQRRGLFADFNGIKFEDYIDFYKHGQKWQNRMILGDSLLVMASLAEKEGMKGKVQMIYMDPPYGIKFRSNWQVSTRSREVKDGNASDLTRQPEQIRAFRDTWELGIHSYLAYLRDRLADCKGSAQRDREHLRSDRGRESSSSSLSVG